MTSGRPALVWGIALLAVLAAALLASLLLGSVRLAPGAVVRALLGDGDSRTVSIVRDLRLPRALLAVLVGGALALSGAALQALLGNPLADPYLLGVSGGAACGTLVGSLLGLGVPRERAPEPRLSRAAARGVSRGARRRSSSWDWGRRPEAGSTAGGSSSRASS